MGAGVVKGEVQTNPGSGTNDIMACESCSTKFTLFKHKKFCVECGRHHCSTCAPPPNSSSVPRRCKKCRLLISGSYSSTDLRDFKVKDLQCFLVRRNVPVRNCKEKAELIELVMSSTNHPEYQQQQVINQQRLRELQERRMQHENEEMMSAATPPQRRAPPPSANDEVPSSSAAQSDANPPPQSAPQSTVTSETQSQSESQSVTETVPPSTSASESPAPKRMTLTQIKDVKDIEDLSVRQLKEVLATNFVNYKGCCEKWELMERVKRLYREHKLNTDAAKKLDNEEFPDHSTDNNLCKICMDAMIDCVLLDCGHMMTCTNCGKQLSECPICRQYIVRVVHTFRA